MDSYNRHPIADEPVENPELLTINPISMYGEYFEKDDKLENITITGVYIHGELQERTGYDQFSFVGQCPKATGVYPAKVLNVCNDATLYIWNDKNKRIHGLVVENDDVDGIRYAIKCYNERRPVL